VAPFPDQSRTGSAGELAGLQAARLHDLYLAGTRDGNLGVGHEMQTRSASRDSSSRAIAWPSIPERPVVCSGVIAGQPFVFSDAVRRACSWQDC
jgi:hypothetical protein